MGSPIKPGGQAHRKLPSKFEQIASRPHGLDLDEKQKVFCLIWQHLVLCSGKNKTGIRLPKSWYLISFAYNEREYVNCLKNIKKIWEREEKEAK